MWGDSMQAAACLASACRSSGWTAELHCQGAQARHDARRLGHAGRPQRDLSIRPEALFVPSAGEAAMHVCWRLSGGRWSIVLRTRGLHFGPSRRGTADCEQLMGGPARAPLHRCPGRCPAPPRLCWRATHPASGARADSARSSPAETGAAAAGRACPRRWGWTRARRPRWTCWAAARAPWPGARPGAAAARACGRGAPQPQPACLPLARKFCEGHCRLVWRPRGVSARHAARPARLPCGWALGLPTALAPITQHSLP